MENTAVQLDQPAKEELTGCLTRKAFERTLTDLESVEGGTQASLIVVQIGRFGLVNDSVGQGIGDKIIGTVAKRLGKLFPHAFAVGRLHGDHFGLLFCDLSDVSNEIDQLLDFAQRPIAVRGEIIVLSVRIGVAESATLGGSLVDLVHAAEVALHKAKEIKTSVAYFDGQMVDQARSVHQLENDLRVSLVKNAAELHQAIANTEFELFYQPIVSTTDESVHAFEALLRWHHPVRGIVSPAVFVPMAEQISVMSILGAWVIRKACQDAVSWPLSRNGTAPSVSINVSPTQFYEPEILLNSIKQGLDESGIDPARIKVEITESADFAPTMRSILEEIRSLGCTVALDDFGTGYSSVAQLVDLPIDYVKVDRSLVKDLESEDAELALRAEKIARSVLGLADSLEVKPIVEGIETPIGLEKIKSLGATLVQGYVFARPMTNSDARDYLQN
jgi:diguanylate cyclase (GGDEF)-like protein